jgi:hypothetical protein
MPKYPKAMLRRMLTPDIEKNRMRASDNRPPPKIIFI